MNRILSFLCLICLFASCRSKQLDNCDLVFVGIRTESVDADSMDSAIAAATGCGDVDITHVGIIEVAADTVWVIDATPRRGVSRRTLDEFKSNALSDSAAVLIFKRVRVDFDKNATLDLVKSCLGRKYDMAFLPDNNDVYCSELVQMCYRRKDGSPLFSCQPMNFKNAEGEYPEFWVRNFEGLGMDIPQGVDGTNPSDMMKSECLMDLY